MLAMDSPRYGVCGISMSSLLIMALCLGMVVVNLQNRKIGREIQENHGISERSVQEQIRLVGKCDGEKLTIQDNIKKETSMKEHIHNQVNGFTKDIGDKDKELEALTKTKSELEAELAAAAAATVAAAAAVTIAAAAPVGAASPAADAVPAAAVKQ